MDNFWSVKFKITKRHEIDASDANVQMGIWIKKIFFTAENYVLNSFDKNVNFLKIFLPFDHFFLFEFDVILISFLIKKEFGKNFCISIKKKHI